MKIVWSAYYELIKNIRDKRFIIALMVFPICMIILLGSVFNGKLTEDIAGKISVGYVINDNGETGSGLKRLLDSPDMRKHINAVEFKSADEASKAVAAGKIDNYFVVPRNIDRGAENGQKALITLDGKKNIEMVKTILDGYISKSMAYKVTMGLDGKIAKIGSHSYFKRIQPLNSRLPSAIDYFSVLTTLQVMTIGTILGILILWKEESSNIHIRMYSLPVSKWTVIAGKIIGNSMFLFASCVVTVVFSKFVYGANWNGNLLFISFVLIIFSFLCIGLGILIAAFTKKISVSIGIAFVFMIVSSIAAGSMAPALTIQSLDIVNPIYYAKVLIFGTLYNYPHTVMLKAVWGILIFLAVVYTTSVLKLRRVNYDNI